MRRLRREVCYWGLVFRIPARDRAEGARLLASSLDRPHIAGANRLHPESAGTAIAESVPEARLISRISGKRNRLVALVALSAATRCTLRRKMLQPRPSNRFA